MRSESVPNVLLLRHRMRSDAPAEAPNALGMRSECFAEALDAPAEAPNALRTRSECARNALRTLSECFAEALDALC